MPLQNIPIRDFAGTERKIAGREVTQGADDLFHQTALVLSHRLDEDTFTLSTTDTVIDLTGMESHLFIELDDTVGGQVLVALEYFTGGGKQPATIVAMIPAAGRPTSVNYMSSFDVGIDVAGEYGSHVAINVATWGNDGARLLAVPTRGAIRAFVKHSTSSYADLNWATYALSPADAAAIDGARPTVRRTRVYASATSGEASYATGELVCNSIEFALEVPQSMALRSSTALEGITIGDYNDVMTDFDVVVWCWGEGYGTDGTPFDPGGVNYFGAVAAIFECRLTPAAGQYKVIDTPSGPICCINERVILPETAYANGPPVTMSPFGIDIVTRAALASAPSVEIEATCNFDP